MLEHLYIKNVAIIDEVEINFKSGLNILSGETGAGKSIIISCVNFVMGEKANKDFIRKGTNSAVVEMLVSINESSVIDEIVQRGVAVDEDNSILISRSVNSNLKTACRINGRVVTIAILKEIVSLLIDVHGQHQHQSLLNPAKHIILLDRFCGEKINEYKDMLFSSYKKYKEVKKNIFDITDNSKDIESKIDILKYQINEIKDADLKEGEEEKLFEQRNILNNGEKLKNYASAAVELLCSSEGAAIDKISSAASNVFNISKLDKSQAETYEKLETILVDLEEIASNIRNYNDNIEYNNEAVNEIELRIDLIYKLKKKYGSTVEDIIKFYNDAENKLDIIVNSEKKINELNTIKKEIEKEIVDICNKITKLRKEQACNIQLKVENILNELGMKNAKFKIDISSKNVFDANGIDKVEFFISANKGQELKPLSKIASGGEISRVMLAIKVVLSNADSIETFIFDEIDTGVSGRTAQQVAQKLSFLAKNRQIICITHLPQIAAMADAHFLIEKKYLKEQTVSNVLELDCNGQINEIARLIGGAEITDFTIKAAQEMKEMADKLK